MPRIKSYFILFLFVVLFFSAVSVEGQIYKPVEFESAALYTAWPNQGETSSLTVLDTIQTESGVEFELYKKWNIGYEPAYPFEVMPDEGCDYDSWGSAGYCAPANIPLWLGPKITQLELNEYQLFSSNGDTLNFNFDLDPGDSTLVYSDDGEYFYMIYETSDLDTYMNYTDSVTKYRMAHLNQSGSVVNSSVNNAPVIIGKNLGIVNFFRIDSFPEMLQPIQIAAHVETQSGLHRLKAEDIFDYEVGDFFQFKYVQSEYAPSTGYTKYVDRTVLERNETDTNITYIFGIDEGKFQNVVEPVDGGFVNTIDTSFASETVENIVSKSEIIAELPLHRHPDDEPYLFEEISFQDNDCGFRWQYVSRKSFMYKCYANSIDCYVNPLNSSENPSIPIYGPTVYEQGLGITSSFGGWQNNLVNNTLSKKLIYYEKSGISCGDQWVLSTDDYPMKEDLKIWPNPSVNEIEISLPSPTDLIEQVELYSVKGKLVYASKTGRTGSMKISTQDLPSGLYIVKAMSKNVIYTQKLVVK